MIKSVRKIYPFYVFTDLIFMVLSFGIPYILRFSFIDSAVVKFNLPNFKEYSFIFIFWAVFILISFNRRNLYSTDRTLTIPKEVFRIVKGIFYTGILIAALIFFGKYKFFSRRVFLGNFFLLLVFLSGWRIVKRLILRELISKGFHNTNVLIVGAGNISRAALKEIRKNPYWGFNLVGFLDDNKEGLIDNVPVLGKLDNFYTVTKKYFIDEVIVTIPSEREAVSQLIKQAKKMHLGLRIVPEDFAEPLQILNISYLGIIPLLTYKERVRHPTEFALKRLFDFLGSLILLILLFPLFVLIAILIKLNSPGPVLYIQKRTGYKGRMFNFYKFRSMIKEADELKSNLMDKNESRGNIIFKIRQDPRITNIGRFLRRYSLDELPQIFNVLKGDMSFIGPRPFPVEESQKLESNHMERLIIRPGITGLAQIRGRSDLSFYRWAKWDLWYINNWSLMLDLKILWWTGPVVLRGRGAY